MCQGMVTLLIPILGRQRKENPQELNGQPVYPNQEVLSPRLKNKVESGTVPPAVSSSTQETEPETLMDLVS